MSIILYIFIKFYVIETTVKHVGSPRVNYISTVFYLILKVFDDDLCRSKM